MPTTPAYYTTPDGYILRTLDGYMIPEDLTNADYVAYQAWVALGNVATPYAPTGV